MIINLLNKFKNKYAAYLNFKIFGMFILGISSGTPLVLTGNLLTTWMFEEGISKGAIGYFSIVTFSYSFKFLWAPLIDNFKLPLFYKLLGRRRGWLVFWQICLIISILNFSQINVANNLILTAIYAAIIAFLSASQDIVLDAFRIEMLTPKEQGPGIAANICGYRVGMLLAGAGGLFFAHYLNWNLTYLILSIPIFLGLITTILFKEPISQISNEYKNFKNIIKNNIFAPFKNFALKPKSPYILGLALVYKLTDAFAGHMNTPFLLEIGFSKFEIAIVVKSYGFIATILGTIIGGHIAYKKGILTGLKIAAILQIFANLLCIIQYYIGHDNIFLAITNSVENICGGVGSAIFIAFLSNVCTNRKYTATEYALLSSIASLGRTILSTPSGDMAEFLGWPLFFVFSCLLSIPTFFIIRKLSKNYDENIQVKNN